MLGVIKPVYDVFLYLSDPITADYYKSEFDTIRNDKALQEINKQLVADASGILSVDTDVPDTRMILVFLLDYLAQTSGMKIVSLAECIA